MNIKRNPISARDEVFCFIITMLFQRGIVIPSVRSSVCLLCYLLLNHWSKSNQVWCASYSYEWGVQQHFFGHLPGAPGRVQRSTIIFEKSISKIFIPNFFCLFSQIKEISLCRLGHTPGGGTWGCCRVKIYFSKHGHVAYLIEGDGEQNGIQVQCSPNRSTIIKFLRKRGGAAPH